MPVVMLKILVFDIWILVNEKGIIFLAEDNIRIRKRSEQVNTMG